MNLVIFVAKVNRYKLILCIKVIHDSSYIKRQAKSGGGYTFSEFCLFVVSDMGVGSVLGHCYLAWVLAFLLV